MGTCSIHIEFVDGSNPYVRYNMSIHDFFEELKKWLENYDLEQLRCIGNIFYYKATEKGVNQNGNEGSAF